MFANKTFANREGPGMYWQNSTGCIGESLIGEITEPQIMTIVIDVHKPFIINVYISSE